MVKRTLTTLLVGSHFHPPAKTLLEFLRAGAPLILRGEPENPYDANAIQVLAPFQSLQAQIERSGAAEVQQFDERLMAQGATMEQVLSTAPAVLGHIAASGGKPLEKAKTEFAGVYQLSGTLEWKEALEVQMEESGTGNFICQLDFAPDGRPMVVANWEEED